jgi:serine O-acetyltransferase
MMKNLLQKSITEHSLAYYVSQQLNNMFDDKLNITTDEVLALFPLAFERLEYCFSHINNKYFFDGYHSIFNHLHGDQYAMFLYLLANTAYKMNHHIVASKIFLLNKALHGIDVFYEVELPSVFLFVHPLATVLGRAQYGDFLLVYQRCSVGSNHSIYPTFDKFLSLRPGASVLGNCHLGKNCTIAAESLLLDKDLLENTVYFGNPRNFSTKQEESISSIWRA